MMIRHLLPVFLRDTAEDVRLGVLREKRIQARDVPVLEDALVVVRRRQGVLDLFEVSVVHARVFKVM